MLCNYPSLCNVVNRTCVSWHRIGFMIEDVIELVFIQKCCPSMRRRLWRMRLRGQKKQWMWTQTNTIICHLMCPSVFSRRDSIRADVWADVCACAPVLGYLFIYFLIVLTMASSKQKKIGSFVSWEREKKILGRWESSVLV